MLNNLLNDLLITGTLKWINPKGIEVDDNSRAPVHVGPDMGRMGVKIFFRNPNIEDSGEYKCQFQRVFNHYFELISFITSV